MSEIVQFQTIQLNISTQFKCKYSLIVKRAFLFRAIQFSQAILIQLIQFIKNRFCLHTITCQNSSMLNNSV